MAVNSAPGSVNNGTYNPRPKKPKPKPVMNGPKYPYGGNSASRALGAGGNAARSASTGAAGSKALGQGAPKVKPDPRWLKTHLPDGSNRIPVDGGAETIAWQQRHRRPGTRSSGGTGSRSSSGGGGGGGGTAGGGRPAKAPKSPKTPKAPNTANPAGGPAAPPTDPFPEPKWAEIYGPAQREIQRQRDLAAAGQAGETKMWNDFNTWSADKIATQNGLNTQAQAAIATQLDNARKESLTKIQGLVDSAMDGAAAGGERAAAGGMTAMAQSQQAQNAASDADQKYQAATAAAAANNLSGQALAAKADAQNQLNRVSSTYGGMVQGINKSANSLDQEIAKARSGYVTDRANFMETQRKADRQYELDKKAAEFLNQNRAAQTGIAQQNADTQSRNVDLSHQDRVAATAQREAAAAARQASKTGTAADKAKAARAKQRATDLRTATNLVIKSVPDGFQTLPPDQQGSALKGIAAQIHAAYPNMVLKDAYKIIIASYGTRAAHPSFQGDMQRIWAG